MIACRVERRLRRGIRKEYDLFIGVFDCLQHFPSCVAHRRNTICDYFKNERLQTRILRFAVMPENVTLSISNPTHLFYIRTQGVPRCKHSPPPL
jgi:hypothetical protein